MTKVIVTTTINPPTKAVKLFDSLPGWHLVVVGDRKTPEDYRLENGTYVGPDDQVKIDRQLSDLIGWNSIQRRNFGLLVAHEMGAEIIGLVDDDNVPFDGWGSNLVVNTDVEVNFYETSLPAFDPVGATNYPQLWHRGYPLQLLAKRDYSQRSRRTVRCGVQADFWNGDPDIDAVCRMQFAPDCNFDPAAFPIAANVISPFNSQNTFISGDLLQDYFLFPHVGRMDDIWGAYYLQATGARVVYTAPSVVQERNIHDLTVDLKKEFLGYEHNLAIVEAVQDDPDALFKFVPQNTVDAFERYRRHF